MSKNNKKQEEYLKEIEDLDPVKDFEKRKWANQAYWLTCHCMEYYENRSDKELQESGELFLTDETLAMAYSVIKKRGRELGLNEMLAYKNLIEIAEMLGYSGEELEGRVDLEFAKPETPGEIPSIEVGYQDPLSIELGLE